MFWDMLLFKSHFPANLVPLAILKNQNFLQKKPVYIFGKSQNLNVSRIFIISVAFYSKFATSNIFQKNIQDFSPENPSFSFKKPKFWTLRENFLFQSHSTANLLPLASLKKLMNFFPKTHLIFSKNPNFEHFEKSY